MYDSRIGRWLTTDPLEKKYQGVSTYNFCINNPILYVDIDGKDIFIPISKNKNDYKKTKYFRLANRGDIQPTNEMIVLRDLQKMTNDKLKLTDVRDAKTNKIIGYRVEIESYNTENLEKEYKIGSKKIKDLIETDKNVIITKPKDGFNAAIPIGNGDTLILYNDKRIANGEDEGVGVTNEDGSKGRPPFLGLGHELGHAENYIEGLFTPEGPFVDGIVIDPDSNKKEPKFTQDELIARKKEIDLRSEHKGEVHDNIIVKQRANVKVLKKKK